MKGREFGGADCTQGRPGTLQTLPDSLGQTETVNDLERRPIISTCSAISAHLLTLTMVTPSFHKVMKKLA